MACVKCEFLVDILFKKDDIITSDEVEDVIIWYKRNLSSLSLCNIKIVYQYHNTYKVNYEYCEKKAPMIICELISNLDKYRCPYDNVIIQMSKLS